MVVVCEWQQGEFSSVFHLDTSVLADSLFISTVHTTLNTFNHLASCVFSISRFVGNSHTRARTQSCAHTHAHTHLTTCCDEFKPANINGQAAPMHLACGSSQKHRQMLGDYSFHEENVCAQKKDCWFDVTSYHIFRADGAQVRTPALYTARMWQHHNISKETKQWEVHVHPKKICYGCWIWLNAWREMSGVSFAVWRTLFDRSKHSGVSPNTTSLHDSLHPKLYLRQQHC